MENDDRKVIRRRSTDIFLTVMGTISSVLTIVGSFFPGLLHTLRLDPVVVGVVGALGLLIFGVPIFVRLLWKARPGFRSAVLVVSQRRWWSQFLLAVGDLVALAIVAGAVSSLGLSALGIGVYAGDGLFLLTLLALHTWLANANRMYIKADQCYYLLRRIDHQRQTGTYEFDADTGSDEIRREARILDYMVARRPGDVKRHRVWGYRLPTSPLENLQKLPADENHTAQASEREKQLAEAANQIWAGGDPMRFKPDEKLARGRLYWHAVGGRAQAVRFARLFGNKLDDLFNGGDGFRTYSVGSPSFVTIVIKGTPGAGKSTLALQVSVTLARQGNLCMYYSLEEERDGLLQSAANFGWDQPGPLTKGVGEYHGVRHLSISQSQDELKSRRDRVKRQGSEPESHEAGGAMDKQVGEVLVSSLGPRAMTFKDRIDLLKRVWGRRLERGTELPEVVRCVVIDSLEGFANVGLDEKRQLGVPRDKLLALKNFFRHRCEMLVVLVEDDGSGQPGFVEFVGDVVIQLGRRVEDGYTFLFAEILKARNQTHALGQTQIKIRSQLDIKKATGAVQASLAQLEAGILAYPSVHYLLFTSQQQSTFDDYTLSSGLSGLDEMLPARPGGRGLRRKSASALLGAGGTGKSLIGMNFLIEGVRENTPTLLLTLRDDEGTVVSQGVPQEPGQMRFSWQNPTDKEHRYHQFDWDLDGVVRWSDEREAARTTSNRSRLRYQPLRFPYLFTDGPLRYKEMESSPRLLAQATAVTTFLNRLADGLREICRNQLAHALEDKGMGGLALELKDIEWEKLAAALRRTGGDHFADALAQARYMLGTSEASLEYVLSKLPGKNQEDAWQYIPWNKRARETAAGLYQLAWKVFEEDLPRRVLTQQLIVDQLIVEQLRDRHLVSRDLAAEQLTAERLAARSRAVEEVGGFAAGGFAAQQRIIDQLIADQLRVQHLGTGELTAEQLTAERLAVERLVAGQPADFVERLLVKQLAAKGLVREQLTAEQQADEQREAEQRATEQLRAAKARTTDAFVDAQLATEPLAATKLIDDLLVKAPGDPSRPKRIEQLPIEVSEGNNADRASRPFLPLPYLHWDSRKWDPETKRPTNDTSLLVVKDWRPGNITPEDFMDQVLRVIGYPTRPTEKVESESVFERVVFDDASELRERFPVLARTRLFLPTLIDMLKARGITSLFLADTEAGPQIETDHGLGVIADHVIQTSIKYLEQVEPEIDAPNAPLPSAKRQRRQLKDSGYYRDRITVVEVRARPGSEQVPHQLRITSQLAGPPERPLQVVELVLLDLGDNSEDREIAG